MNPTAKKVLIGLGIIALIGGIYAFSKKSKSKVKSIFKKINFATLSKEDCEWLIAAAPKLEEARLDLKNWSDWELTDQVTFASEKLHSAGRLMDVGNNPFSMTRDQKIDAMNRIILYLKQNATDCAKQHGLTYP